MKKECISKHAKDKIKFVRNYWMNLKEQEIFEALTLVYVSQHRIGSVSLT